MPRDEPRVPGDTSTVADLLQRNTPTQHPPDVTAISVGSLLRREGHGPHCVDRPVRPRAHHQRVAEPDSGPRISSTAARRRAVRRTAVAAGTLLTAGSVFGAAMLTGPFAVPDVPQAREGSTPGWDVFDGHPAADGVIPEPRPGNDAVIAGFRSSAVRPLASLTIPILLDPSASGATTGRPAAALPPSGVPADGAPSTGAVGRAAPDAAAPGTGVLAAPARVLADAPSVGPAYPDTAPGRAGSLATVATSGREAAGEAIDVFGSAAPGSQGTPMRSPSGTDDSAEPATELPYGDETERDAQQPALSSLDRSDDDPKPDGLLHSVGRTAAGLLGD
ncbi:MAG: hypothetical protein ACRDRH_16220 [Pseudonocardia sp.]